MTGPGPIGGGFIRDGKTDAKHLLAVNPDGSINIAGSVTIDVSTVEIGEVVLKDGASSNTAAISSAGRLSVDGSGVTQPVSASALPLPLGAGTAANQATVISSLGTINTSLSGASTAARQDTGNSSLAAIQASVAGATPAGSNNIGHVTVDNASFAVTGAFFQATQPISGAVSFTVPQHVIVDSASSVGVTGPLTDAQLRATAVPVSGTFWQSTQPVSISSMPSTPVTGTFWQATQPVSGTFWQATQPVSAASLPLPSGAALEAGNLATIAAAEATGNTSLATIATQTTASAASLVSIDAGIPAALGAAAIAGSMPVNLASDQVEVFERQYAVSAALLMEMRLLRQAVQDWLGQPDSRLDTANDYSRSSVTQLQ